MIEMKRFAVWEDNQEQWDESTIDSPAETLNALSADCAAHTYVERNGAWTDYAEVIVRDEETQEYFAITLVRGWDTKQERPISLKELLSE